MKKLFFLLLVSVFAFSACLTQTGEEVESVDAELVQLSLGFADSQLQIEAMGDRGLLNVNYFSATAEENAEPANAELGGDFYDRYLSVLEYVEGTKRLKNGSFSVVLEKSDGTKVRYFVGSEEGLESLYLDLESLFTAEAPV
jgi:hypothetical protein